MKVNFFLHELEWVGQRFNQTFGSQAVCDLQTRCRVILAIIHMGFLNEKIIHTENKDKVRAEIKQFVKAKNVLNNIFDQAEKCWEERGCEKDATTCSTQQTRIQ